MSKTLCASFPCSNLSAFLPIFFKLCIDIGIGEEWYGIASGIISLRNKRVMALGSCPFLLNISRMNRRISIKFCICIDIYIYIYIYDLHLSIYILLFLIFQPSYGFDLCTKCVSPKYLLNKWLHFEKILLVLLSKFKMHTKSERSGGVSW